MLLVSAVVEVLGEECVGGVKPRDTGLEPSEIAPKIPSPFGDIATSSTVFLRRSNGFMSPIGSNSDDPVRSVNGRNVFGLTCGDVNNPFPSIPLVSR